MQIVFCFWLSSDKLLLNSNACEKTYFGDAEQYDIACKCNASTEDSLVFDWPKEDDIYLRVYSDKLGARFQVDQLKAVLNGSDEEADYSINIQANTRLQQVVGFGGSFTDSAAICFMELPEDLKRKALNDYFGQNGLDYSIGRIPIAGTDMSTRAYSYDDLPPGVDEDFELKYFKLQPEDLEYKIPLLSEINELRKKERNLEPLKLFAASWSAPAWMKSNNNLVQGHLKVDSQHYDAYARYIVRFLQEYEQFNLSMWALSPQNEPFTPKRVGPKEINFNSVNFNPKQMRDYLESGLIPNLIEAGKTADKLKLFIWDDTLDSLYNYQQAMLSSQLVRNYTTGLAIHWYSQGLREISYRHLYDTRRNLPPKYALISTEASFIGHPKPGNWERGQRYGRDILENLRAGSIGWIDWNLALDMSGGPTWSHNNLDSAILVDQSTSTYYKNPMFYALGHVSRFIRPGAHIVATTITPKGSSIPSLTGLRQDEIVFIAAENEEHPSPSSPLKGEVEQKLSALLDKSKTNQPMEEIIKSSAGDPTIKRKFSTIVMNRSPNKRKVRLHLNDCLAKINQPDLVLDLEANSMTSLAFVC